ncbi:putative ribonuclease H-like domain-containing protein [Tanacetum coccineum]|uniref:Ribonuclease H-like domain-containing protein n=1 Tax=Tanacetum coccineum TaxID=301880 RepID=A0ABQ4WI14_9ASTR
MRPFGCPVTILNTLDHLGKFDGKADEGFFVGYSVNSKAFRVFNSRNRIVEENLHITFLENKPNVVGSGPEWLFDIDTLTKSMNYKPVVTKNQTNGSACTKESIDAGQAGKKTVSSQEEEEKNDDEDPVNKEEQRVNQENDASVNNTNTINTVSSTSNVDGIEDNAVNESIVYGCEDDLNMPNLEEIFYSEDDEGVGTEADMNNLNTFMPVSPIPTTRLHKDHPLKQIIKDIHLAPQTRRMTRSVTDHVEPKKVIQALADLSWIEAMQDELLQIEAIRVFLAYASFKDFVVYQMDVKSAFMYGKIEEEVYVYQPLRFKDPEFPDKVYNIEKALYGLHQAPRACDILLVQVYVDDIHFGSTKKSLCTEFEKLMRIKFQMSFIGELTFFLGLQVTQKDDGIFISQDKYMDEILKKFGFSTVKIASTPMETSKPLLKDAEVEDVDLHLYRSMIGSLMYLTYLRPNIMFTVCACARF